MIARTTHVVTIQITCQDDNDIGPLLCGPIADVAKHQYNERIRPIVSATEYVFGADDELNRQMLRQEKAWKGSE